MQSLVINNYKNFENLTLGNLANVNLIVGKNNVGKSTLLEAISIVASNGDVNWIKELLEIRGESVRFSSRENNIEKEIEINILYPIMKSMLLHGLDIMLIARLF